MRLISLAATLGAAVLAAGCSSGTGSDPQPQLNGSGAFGLVSVGGKQKLYVPLASPSTNGHAQIAVVDLSVAGNGTAGAKALLGTIDLGASTAATTLAGGANLVVAASTDAATLWFIDPRTDALVGTTTLPAGIPQSTFSGGGGYVTGVVVDEAKNQAILGVGDGFLFLDLSTRAFGAHVQAPPAENFGFDSVARRIVAPFYDCPPAAGLCSTYLTPSGGVQSDGLTVIDLLDDTVYQYRLGASPPSGPTSEEPVGGEPDSAAVDTSSGVAVVPSESDGSLNIVDLAHASFDRTGRTFTAPQHVIASSGYEGVAVEASGHFAFFENHYSPGLAIVDLAAANAGDGSGFLNATLPDLPDGTLWSNAGDPHGILAALSDRGRPVGLLVNLETTWVARVDLATMAAAAHATPGVLTQAELAPAVTYLDLTP